MSSTLRMGLQQVAVFALLTFGVLVPVFAGAETVEERQAAVLKAIGKISELAPYLPNEIERAGRSYQAVLGSKKQRATFFDANEKDTDKDPVWLALLPVEELDFAKAYPDAKDLALNSVEVTSGYLIVAASETTLDLDNTASSIKDQLEGFIDGKAKTLRLQSGVNLLARTDISQSEVIEPLMRPLDLRETAATVRGVVGTDVLAFHLQGKTPIDVKARNSLSLSMELDGIRPSKISRFVSSKRMTLSVTGSETGQFQLGGKTDLAIGMGIRKLSAVGDIIINPTPGDDERLFEVTAVLSENEAKRLSYNGGTATNLTVTFALTKDYQQVLTAAGSAKTSSGQSFEIAADLDTEDGRKEFELILGGPSLNALTELDIPGFGEIRVQDVSRTGRLSVGRTVARDIKGQIYIAEEGGKAAYVAFVPETGAFRTDAFFPGVGGTPFDIRKVTSGLFFYMSEDIKKLEKAKLPPRMRDLLERAAPGFDATDIKSGTPNGSDYDTLNVLFSQRDSNQTSYDRLLDTLLGQSTKLSFVGQVDSKLFDEPEDDIDEYFRRSRDGRRVEKTIIDSLFVKAAPESFSPPALPGITLSDSAFGVYFDGKRNGTYDVVAGFSGELKLPGWRSARAFGVLASADAKPDGSGFLQFAGGEFEAGTDKLKRGGIAVSASLGRSRSGQLMFDHVRLSGQIAFPDLLSIPVRDLKSLRFQDVYLSAEGISADLAFGRASGRFYVAQTTDDIILGIAAQNLDVDAFIPGLSDTPLRGIDSIRQAVLLRLDRNGDLAQGESRIDPGQLPAPLEAALRQISAADQRSDEITLTNGANYWSEINVARNPVLADLFRTTTGTAPQTIKLKGVLPAELFRTVLSGKGQSLSKQAVRNLDGVNVVAAVPGFQLPGMDKFVRLDGAATLAFSGQEGELFVGVNAPVAGRLPFLDVDFQSDIKAALKSDGSRKAFLALDVPVRFPSRFDAKPIEVSSRTVLSLDGVRDFALTISGNALLRDIVGYDVPGFGALALDSLSIKSGLAEGKVKLGDSETRFALISGGGAPVVALATSGIAAEALIPGLSDTPLNGLKLGQSSLLFARPDKKLDVGLISSVPGLPADLRAEIEQAAQNEVPWTGGLYLNATAKPGDSKVLSQVMAKLGQTNPGPLRLYGALPGEVLSQLTSLRKGNTGKSGLAANLLSQVNLEAQLPGLRTSGTLGSVALRGGKLTIRGREASAGGAVHLVTNITGGFDLAVPLPAERFSVQGNIEIDSDTALKGVVLRMVGNGTLGPDGNAFKVSGVLGLQGAASRAEFDWAGDITLGDLSGLKDPVLREVKLSKARFSTHEVSGSVELAGAQTSFSIFRDSGAKLPVLALAQKQFDAARLIPGIAGTPLDTASLENGVLIIAPAGTSGLLEPDELPEIIAAALKDDQARFEALAFGEGVNVSVVASIKAGSPLGQALGVVGTKQSSFRFAGRIPARQLEAFIKGQLPRLSTAELRDVQLVANIPEIALPHIGKVIELQSSQLKLVGTQVSGETVTGTAQTVVKLLATGGMNIKFPGKDIKLDGQLAFEKGDGTTNLMLAGFAPVNWSSAFGIPFLTLKEMKVSAVIGRDSSPAGVQLASETKVMIADKLVQASGDLTFSTTGLKDLKLALQNNLSVGDLPLIGSLPLINEFSLKSAEISRAGLIATVDWPALGLSDAKLSATRSGGSNVGMMKLPKLDLAQLVEKAGGGANSILAGLKLPEAGLIFNSSPISTNLFKGEGSGTNPLAGLLSNLPTKEISSGVTLLGRINRENLPGPVADLLANQLNFFDHLDGDLVLSGRIGNLLKKSGAFELAAELPRFKFPAAFEIPGVLDLDDTKARFALGADLTQKTAHLGIYSDISLNVLEKSLKLEGGLGVAKKQNGLELALNGRSGIDWAGAFGLPFVNLKDIGISGRLKAGSGGRELDVGLDAVTLISDKAVKGLWEIQVRDGALKDIVLSLDNELKLADIPFVNQLPGIGVTGDFQIANASISMRGFSADVKWPSLGLDGKTAFFQAKNNIGVAMMEVPNLDLAALSGAIPGSSELQKVFTSIAGLKFPKAVISFSTAEVKGLDSATLPDIAGDMIRDIHGSDSTILIPGGVALMGAITPDDLPTGPIDIKNMLVEDLGIFGPKGAKIDRLILAGGLRGILNGNLDFYLAAKVPSLEFGDDLKSFASLVNFDRAGSEFFVQFSLQHLAARIGVAGDITLDIPRLAQPEVRDKVSFKGSLLASVDAVSWVGAFKLTGIVDGEWRSPFGINENMTLRKAAITVGGDPDGSAEFGIKAGGQWRLLDGGSGGKKNFDFTSEFVTSINFAAGGIPLPKKLGLNLEFGEQTELSLLSQLEIMDASMRGIVMGPLAGEIAKGLGTDAAKGFDAFKGVLNDPNTSLVKAMHLDQLPLRLLTFKGAQVMFRTPGAVIPGEEGDSTVGFVTKGRFFSKVMGQSQRELGVLDNRLTFKDGLKVYGDLNPIKLGPLDLRRANIDIAAGLNPIAKPPYFKLEGDVSLFPGTYDRTTVNLSKDQISFRIAKDYGEVGKLDVTAETPEGANLLSSDTDFIVTATGRTEIDKVLFEKIFPVLKIPAAVETWLKKTTPLFINGFSFEGGAKSFVRGDPLLLSVQHKIFGDPEVPDVNVRMEPVWKTGRIEDLFLGHQVIEALGQSFFTYLQEHPQQIQVSDLGPLKLSAEAELTAGTVKKGGQEANALVVKTRANLLGLSDQSVIISMLPEYFLLRTTGNLAGLFKSDIYVWSEGGSVLSPDRVEYWAGVDNGLTNWLQVKMGGVIGQGRQEVNNNLNVAQKKLAEARANVEKIEQQIESKRAEVRGKREAGANLLKRARDVVGAQRSKLSNLEDSRKNLRRQRLSAERSWNLFEKLKIPALWIAEQGVVVAIRIAKETLKIVQSGLDVASRAVENFPVDLHPEVAPLIFAKSTALAGVSVAETSVKAAQSVANNTITLADKLVQGAIKPANMNIKRATMKGTLAANIVDTKGDLYLEGDFWNHNDIETRIAFDVGRPERTQISDLARLFLSLFENQEVTFFRRTAPEKPVDIAQMVLTEEDLERQREEARITRERREAEEAERLREMRSEMFASARGDLPNGGRNISLRRPGTDKCLTMTGRNIFDGRFKEIALQECVGAISQKFTFDGEGFVSIGNPSNNLCLDHYNGQVTGHTCGSHPGRRYMLSEHRITQREEDYCFAEAQNGLAVMQPCGQDRAQRFEAVVLNNYAVGRVAVHNGRDRSTGLTDGNISQNIETPVALTPTVMIDLGKVYRIDRIKLFGIDRQAKDLVMMISADPFDGVPIWSWPNDAISRYRVGDIVADKGFVTNAVEGRYVMVTREAYGALNLSEISVFGDSEAVSDGKSTLPVRNIARGKKAWQRYDDSGGSSAAYAVDGNTYAERNPGSGLNGSWMESASGSLWWEVDLGDYYPIREVRLHAHRGQTLKGLEVLLGTEPFGNTLYRGFAGDGVVRRGVGEDVRQASIELNRDVARYVRVRNVNGTRLGLAEVEVLGTGRTVSKPPSRRDYVNLALDKSVSMSRQLASATVAANGNDGIIGRAENQIAYAAADQHPWWQVDLGEVYKIDRVIVENYVRSQPVMDRMNGARIFISRYPIETDDLDVIERMSSVRTMEIRGGHETYDLKVSDGTYGRYVRIQARAQEYLNFAELSVLGRVKDGASPPAENLAVDQLVSASSSEPGHAPERGVDNWMGGLFHSTEEQNPWWEVDLGAHYPIEMIRVFNRTDCCQERLNDVRVTASNYPFSRLDDFALEQHVSDKSRTVVIKNVPYAEADFMRDGKGLTARYIRLQALGNRVLNFREVQVFGRKTPRSFSEGYPYGRVYSYDEFYVRPAHYPYCMRRNGAEITAGACDTVYALYQDGTLRDSANSSLCLTEPSDRRGAYRFEKCDFDDMRQKFELFDWVNSETRPTKFENAIRMKIRNRQSGQCIDMSSSDVRLGTQMLPHACVASSFQEWEFTPHQNFHRIKGPIAVESHGSDRRRLDVNSRNEVVIYRRNGDKSQQWEMLGHPYDSSNTFRLQSVANGRCLEPESDKSHARVKTYTCRRTTAGQLWRWNGNRLQHARSGMCVDVRGAKDRDMTDLILYRCHNDWNQQWRH